MTKIKVKASKQARQDQADRGDFVDAPIGWYIFKLRSIEQNKSKSGNDQLEVVWQPVGLGTKNKPLPEAYSQIWDYVTLDGDETEWKRAQFLNAIGAKSMDIEIDEGKPGTVIGTLVLGKVRADANLDGDYKAKIGTLRPWDGKGSDDGDDEEEEATEDVWTKKSLKALDPAELKAAAKEFGIKTKGKTAKDVIVEILESQDESY